MPEAKPLPSVETLRSLYVYDPATGKLTHRVSRRGISGGVEAGTPNKGYKAVKIRRAFFPAHRIIWKMMTGREPRGFIDHINGIRDDNRIENLREVSTQANAMNRGTGRGASRFRGVALDRAVDRWRADIGMGGRRKFLGHFDVEEDAARAYDAAARVMFGHQAARLNFPEDDDAVAALILS